MRRSDFYIKVTTVVLFLAVLSYISVYIYSAVKNTYITAPAVSYTVEETAPAAGFLVREETVLAGASGAILPIAEEGEKVSKGQTVAVGYKSGDTLAIAGEIRTLRMMISQIEENMAYGPVDNAALALVSVMELSGAVLCGELSELDALALRVESHVFNTGEVSETELSSLRARLRSLEAQNAGTQSITATASGVYSAVTDGFENVKPDMVEGLSPTALEALFSGGGSNTSAAAGKLVTGITWYYAAVMDTSSAARLYPKQNVTLRFVEPYRAYLQMTVEKIGRNEEGSCVVLFSSNRSLAETAAHRFVRAEVVFGAAEGIRVPKEAIHLSDDGQTLIYLETAGRSEPVYVNIISELGDGYIVEGSGESETALRPGAIVIVKANGLVEGMVAPK